MAIAKNPKRALNVGNDQDAETFISGAPKLESVDERENKKPTMIRIEPALLTRIDRAAKRLGISRSAFIVSSTAERLERME